MRIDRCRWGITAGLFNEHHQVIPGGSHGGQAGTPPLAPRQQLQAKSMIRFFSSKLR
jgi:hypothetical protein